MALIAPIDNIFCRIPVVLESRRSAQRGGGGAHTLHPPPRSVHARLSFVGCFCGTLRHALFASLSFAALGTWLPMLTRAGHLGSSEYVKSDFTLG